MTGRRNGNSRPNSRPSGASRDPNRPLELFIRQPYYGMIARGEKTIEGRAAYRSIQRAREGLPLHFKRGDDSPVLRCVIDWTVEAPTFEEGLLEVEWQKAIPGVGRFDDALAIYNRIYPPDRVEEIGGVIMIGFTVVRNTIQHGPAPA